jgi:hypothetical protein
LFGGGIKERVMIDIFQQPDLYISDIKVSIDGSKIPFKEYLKIHRIRRFNEFGKLTPTIISQTIERVPVLLINGEFPDEVYEKNFIERHFDNIPKGNYEYEVEFFNTKFSSKIQYYYNLDHG